MRKSIQIRWIMEFNVWSVFLIWRLRILIRRKKFINWNKINYLYIHWFYPFIRSTSLIVLAKTNASVIFPLLRRILTITGQFPLSFDLTIAPAFFLHFIKFSLSLFLSYRLKLDTARSIICDLYRLFFFLLYFQLNIFHNFSNI